MPKESLSQQRKVKKVMKEFKEGKLKGGKGKHPKVKSRKQAIAIALSEAKVKPRTGDIRAKKKKTTASKSSSPRKTTRTKATASKHKPTKKPTARKAPARRRAAARKKSTPRR
jgi:hypothetical protein